MRQPQLQRASTSHTWMPRSGDLGRLFSRASRPLRRYWERRTYIALGNQLSARLSERYRASHRHLRDKLKTTSTRSQRRRAGMAQRPSSVAARTDMVLGDHHGCSLLYPKTFDALTGHDRHRLVFKRSTAPRAWLRCSSGVRGTECRPAPLPSPITARVAVRWRLTLVTITGRRGDHQAPLRGATPHPLFDLSFIYETETSRSPRRPSSIMATLLPIRRHNIFPRRTFIANFGVTPRECAVFASDEDELYVR